jgi:hypothetical protein
MRVFAIGIVHTLDVPRERPHDTDARQHCRAAVLRDQDVPVFRTNMPQGAGIGSVKRRRPVNVPPPESN